MPAPLDDFGIVPSSTPDYPLLRCFLTAVVTCCGQVFSVQIPYLDEPGSPSACPVCGWRYRIDSVHVRRLAPMTMTKERVN